MAVMPHFIQFFKAIMNRRYAKYVQMEPEKSGTSTFADKCIAFMESLLHIFIEHAENCKKHTIK